MGFVILGCVVEEESRDERFLVLVEIPALGALLAAVAWWRGAVDGDASGGSGG